MKYVESITETVGGTPLVKLNRFSRGLDFNIFAKVEYFNPGGSAKDRIALAMIEDAEKRGLLKKGSTIIEATAGNTGAGLAMIAARRGYKCVFVVPDKMSDEKINLLKAYGAGVITTRTDVTPDSPENYNNLADRIAANTRNSFRPSQFSNHANPNAHYLSTGPEIYEQLDGKVDAVVAGIGTGGTISGVGRFLKERIKNLKVVGADPIGSILSGGESGSYKVEGIGEDFFPETFDRSIVDAYVRVSDKDSFAAARRLAVEEGILAGGSSGTALAAAVEFGKTMPQGSNIVAVLIDTGRNYLSKIFSDEWMSENGFLTKG